ncbi:D-ribose pyranase [Alkalibacillus haloalkaliphilus]|uniref:D-ribose pyranase n=1 Tax=Alkalibacillus haloalkaliphilus TaxID=94136 RepID=A0A511W7E2_9BACI|nr:D-ribose pyranase [Alkalibacillus haloalkaliphilus]GEN46651.1 D-ribose pyranase [Alkalibacillus haloalkaliphilus]
MKKQGILNSEIASVLAQLGHTDTIVIADCGLPVPDGVKRIDLALTKGTPSFVETLQAILADMEVEHVTLASEIKTNNEHVLTKIEQHYQGEKDFVSHEDFKKLTKDAKVVIRTGETTPFANIILRSGVIF